MKKNLQGFLVGETHRECCSCNTIFERWGKNNVYCKPCNNERVKSYNREYRMWMRAKTRAKERGRAFTLKPTDITIPDLCPILGIPMVTHSGKSGGMPDSPALDRRDSTGGYTPDNVWVISQRANQMKADASPEEMVRFAKWVLETYDKQNPP